MFLIFNCYCCYSLPFLQQKPCQKRKLLIMRKSAKTEVSENGHFIRFRTLEAYSFGLFLFRRLGSNDKDAVESQQDQHEYHELYKHIC